MTKTCKRPVGKTMCEADNGHRTGKYGTTKYESNRKYARSTTAKTTKKGGASRPSPKVKPVKTKSKTDSGWEKFKRMRIRDTPMYSEDHKCIDCKNDLEDPLAYLKNRYHPKNITQRESATRDAYLKMQLARKNKRKKIVNRNRLIDTNDFVPDAFDRIDEQDLDPSYEDYDAFLQKSYNEDQIKQAFNNRQKNKRNKAKAKTTKRK